MLRKNQSLMNSERPDYKLNSILKGVEKINKVPWARNAWSEIRTFAC